MSCTTTTRWGHDRPALGWSSPGIIVAAAAVAVLAIVATESVVALAIVLLEGTVSLAVLGSAALAGGWCLKAFGLGAQPWPERLVIGAALGVGTLALVILAMGSVGALGQTTAWILVAAVALAGLARLGLDLVRPAGGPIPPPQTDPSPSAIDADAGPWRWLWLLAVPFLALTLLAASLPPGVLWQEEGFGYDVLEYHLAVPKTYFEQGRIGFLPTNVYGSFPANGEMLFWLMLLLRRDPIQAAFMAQIGNVALASLFVAAAWLIGRTWSPRAGIVAGLLAATCPWLAYLAGIAYVEAGLLAMGMATLAAVLRATENERHAGRWSAAAGSLAGLACGFKYTAGPLVAIPLAILLLCGRTPWPMRLRTLLTFVATAIVTFAPWMIRNTVNTGNPIFPLAYSVFGARDGLWDADLETRWQRAHGSAEAERTDSSPARRAWDRTFGDMRMGWLVAVLAAAGVWPLRHRRTLALLAILALQGAFWLLATHLFARFAVVGLIPLIALAAQGTSRFRSPKAAALLCGLLIAGSGWNLYRLTGLYYDHTRIGPSREPINAYGQTQWFVTGQWPGTQHVGAINALDGRAHVLMVGEARTFYLRRPCEYAVAFNHHPLAQAAREIPDDDALMRWLQNRGTTHLLFHWDELARLGTTYGLDPAFNAGLLPRLKAAGLKERASFSDRDGAPPYATLYEVPRHE